MIYVSTGLDSKQGHNLAHFGKAWGERYGEGIAHTSKDVRVRNDILARVFEVASFLLLLLNQRPFGLAPTHELFIILVRITTIIERRLLQL